MTDPSIEHIACDPGISDDSLSFWVTDTQAMPPYDCCSKACILPVKIMITELSRDKKYLSMMHRKNTSDNRF